MRLLCGRGGGGRGQGGQGGYAGHHRHYHHYLQIHQIHDHDHDHRGYNVLITLTIRMSDPRSLFSRLTVAYRDSKTSLVFRWLDTNINDLHCHYEHFDGHYNIINMSMIIIQLQPQ